MSTIEIATEIRAPAERCFDLSRDIDFHKQSFSHTNERAIAGRTSGLIELGESVTWEARHFGVIFRMTNAITAVDRPHHFRDEMVSGPFHSFKHDHRFEERDGVTLMIDEIALRSPLGPLGWLVDLLVMQRYMRNLIQTRAEAIKREAERSR